jgi:pectate lyase
VQSQIYAQNNFFAAGSITADRFISRFNGTAIFADGTFVNGHSRHDRVDVVAAYNAARDPDLSPTASWTPVLFVVIDPTQSLPGQVGHGAGPLAVQ